MVKNESMLGYLGKWDAGAAEGHMLATSGNDHIDWRVNLHDTYTREQQPTIEDPR